MSNSLKTTKNHTESIRKTFPVLEMTCAACAVSVESMLKATKGVRDAGVNYANQSAWVDFDAAEVTPLNLQNAIRSIGYDLVIDTEDPQAIQEESQQKSYEEIKQRTIWSAVLAVPVVILGMFFMDMPYGNIISMLLTAPVVFYFGRNFFIHAFKQARHGKANMDTLVALSTGIAFAFSVFNTFFPQFWYSRGINPHVYYEAAAVVIVFISLGKLLEERAKSKTSSAIKN
jgi:Cu2+-exporting ATPase